MRLSHIVCTTCVFLSPAMASAQRLTDLAIGRRIRVETVTHDVFFGPMQSVSADTVRIGTGAGQAPVALAMHNVLGYSFGMGPDRRRGALTGLSIGGGVGLVFHFLFRNIGTQSSKEGRRRFGYTAAAVSGLLGATIGASLPPERWSAPTLPDAR